MPLVAAYHRPETIEDAQALLSQPHRIPLAGGTTINADRNPSDLEAVDLQALGLNGIESADGRVRIGAMTTLAEVAESDRVPATLRRVARAEKPSTLRTLATVGGAIAMGSAESRLVAALLAHDATVTIHDPTDAIENPLASLLASEPPAGRLILAASVATEGISAEAATGRTPADMPIVSAIARRDGDHTWLALSGVADRPVLVDPDDPTRGLTPPGDFRGSSAYRLELARVLSARALEGVR